MPVTRFSLNLCEKATIATSGRGFSLLELVLVMVIGATLAAIALPRMSSSGEHARANAAVSRIESILDEARMTARTGSSPVTISFDTTTGVVQVSHRAGKANWDFSAGPYRARFTSVSLGGDATLIVNGFGVSDSGGTIVVSAGSIAKTITLSTPPAEAAGKSIGVKRGDELRAAVGEK